MALTRFGKKIGPIWKLMVLRGNVPPLSVKRYTLPPLEFLNKGNIELHEWLLNFGIIPASFGLIYTLIEFLVI